MFFHWNSCLLEKTVFISVFSATEWLRSSNDLIYEKDENIYVSWCGMCGDMWCARMSQYVYTAICRGYILSVWSLHFFWREALKKKYPNKPFSHKCFDNFSLFDKYTLTLSLPPFRTSGQTAVVRTPFPLWCLSQWSPHCCHQRMDPLIWSE